MSQLAGEARQTGKHRCGGQLAGEARQTVGNTVAVPREPAHLRPSLSSAALLFQAELMS